MQVIYTKYKKRGTFMGGYKVPWEMSQDNSMESGGHRRLPRKEDIQSEPCRIRGVCPAKKGRKGQKVPSRENKVCSRRWAELRTIPCSTEIKEQRGEILAWKSRQEPESSVLVKGLKLLPKHKRKLLKGFQHKSDLSLSFFFFCKKTAMSPPC